MSIQNNNMRAPAAIAEDLLVNELTVGGDVLDRAYFWELTKVLNDRRMESLKERVRVRVADFYSGVNELEGRGPGLRDSDVSFIDRSLDSWFSKWSLAAGRMDSLLGEPGDDLYAFRDRMVNIVRDALKDPNLKAYHKTEIPGWLYFRSGEASFNYMSLPDDVRSPEFEAKFKKEGLPFDAMDLESDLLSAAYTMGRAYQDVIQPGECRGLEGDVWSRAFDLDGNHQLDGKRIMGLRFIDFEDCTNVHVKFAEADSQKEQLMYYDELPSTVKSSLMEEIFNRREAARKNIGKFFSDRFSVKERTQIFKLYSDENWLNSRIKNDKDRKLLKDASKEFSDKYGFDTSRLSRYDIAGKFYNVFSGLSLNGMNTVISDIRNKGISYNAPEELPYEKLCQEFKHELRDNIRNRCGHYHLVMGNYGSVFEKICDYIESQGAFFPPSEIKPVAMRDADDKILYGKIGDIVHGMSGEEIDDFFKRIIYKSEAKRDLTDKFYTAVKDTQFDMYGKSKYPSFYNELKRVLPGHFTETYHKELIPEVARFICGNNLISHCDINNPFTPEIQSKLKDGWAMFRWNRENPNSETEIPDMTTLDTYRDGGDEIVGTIYDLRENSFYALKEKAGSKMYLPDNPFREDYIEDVEPDSLVVAYTAIKSYEFTHGPGTFSQAPVREVSEALSEAREAIARVVMMTKHSDSYSEFKPYYLLEGLSMSKDEFCVNLAFMEHDEKNHARLLDEGLMALRSDPSFAPFDSASVDVENSKYAVVYDAIVDCMNLEQKKDQEESNSIHL